MMHFTFWTKRLIEDVARKLWKQNAGNVVLLGLVQSESERHVFESAPEFLQ